MSIDISLFERKTFQVEGIRVTGANLSEVAEWCGGSVKESRPTGYSDSYPYVEVVVGHVASRTQLARATVGMWVTRLPKTNQFRVYKARSFAEAFEAKTSKYEEVLALVEGAMGGNSWSVDAFGEALQAEDVAKEIVRLFGEE